MGIVALRAGVAPNGAFQRYLEIAGDHCSIGLKGVLSSDFQMPCFPENLSYEIPGKRELHGKTSGWFRAEPVLR